jgi:hypothetical protein
MAVISSSILGFFMVSLGIREESMSPFLKNITIDLSATSRMMFFFAKSLDEFQEGLSFLLDDTSQIPVDTQACACGAEGTGEQPVQVILGMN